MIQSSRDSREPERDDISMHSAGRLNMLNRLAVDDMHLKMDKNSKYRCSSPFNIPQDIHVNMHGKNGFKIQSAHRDKKIERPPASSTDAAAFSRMPKRLPIGLRRWPIQPSELDET